MQTPLLREEATLRRQKPSVLVEKVPAGYQEHSVRGFHMKPVGGCQTRLPCEAALSGDNSRHVASQVRQHCHY